MNTLPSPKSLWQNAASRFLRHKPAVFSTVLLGLIILMALLGPYLSPFSLEDTDWSAIFQPPSWSTHHYFGTDELGRDLFVRTMQGGRISLLVGLVASLISVIIGVSYGLVAGYLGGKTDTLMMRIVDILYALPFMFFVILLMTFFGRQFILLFVAIGAISWLDMARIVRGQTLQLRHKEFIDAAKLSGASTTALLWRHLLPNLLGIVVIYTTLTVPSIILTESFISFLGLGIQEPMTSWGVLINEGSQNMSVAWWSLLFPGALLSLTLYCCHFIGDGLRDALDPKDTLL